jgi:hypothetical protein
MTLLSTSTIARNNNIKPKDLFNYLMVNKFLYKESKDYKLTDKGFGLGGEYIENKSFTMVVWNDKHFNKIIKKLSPHIENSTFKYPMEFLSIRSKFGQNVSDGIWESLNSGVKVLQTEEQLNQYLHSYGRMHHAKIHAALVELLREKRSVTRSSLIEIIDYGCGQGLATIVLLNILNLNTFPIDNIKKITLIEPGNIALDRAVDFLKNSCEIVRINKGLDSLSLKDLRTQSNTIKIHLFSNILDMGGKHFSIENLAKKIRSTQAGDNYFVCVSAINEMELEQFTEEIAQVKFKNQIEEILERQGKDVNLKGKVIFSPDTQLDTLKFISKETSDIHNPSNPNKPWKRIHMVFKKEF